MSKVNRTTTYIVFAVLLFHRVSTEMQSTRSVLSHFDNFYSQCCYLNDSDTTENFTCTCQASPIKCLTNQSVCSRKSRIRILEPKENETTESELKLEYMYEYHNSSSIREVYLNCSRRYEQVNITNVIYLFPEDFSQNCPERCDTILYPNSCVTEVCNSSFPMSERFCNYSSSNISDQLQKDCFEDGENATCNVTVPRIEITDYEDCVMNYNSSGSVCDGIYHYCYPKWVEIIYTCVKLHGE